MVSRLSREPSETDAFTPLGLSLNSRRRQSITSRFEEQVRKYPDRLAVKTRNHQVTYDELNRSANRVANQLLAGNNHEQTPVAMLFAQGIPGVATILGVLKAGMSYVALDPFIPRARLKDMLSDSAAKLIVTNGQNLALAKGLARITALCLILTNSIQGSRPKTLDCPCHRKPLPTSCTPLARLGCPKGSFRTTETCFTPS
jgi:non-ribosomal peptide synthetase component F